MSVQSHLQDIGLVQYTHILQHHGFETWKDLSRITESDLEQIGMLLGHRRKLQRALHLSSARENRTLSPVADKEQRQKRRYRRHPKRDPNAPPRPDNAYQLFAHDVRQRMQGHGMSFVELARIVGRKWAVQSVDERKVWTSNALKAKAQFQDRLNLYKTSPQYLQYQQYLQDFKNQQQLSLPVWGGSEARNNVTSRINRPSEPTRDVANVGLYTTQQQEQVTARVTEGNMQFPEIDQYKETKHSLLTHRRKSPMNSNDNDENPIIEDSWRRKYQDPSMSTTQPEQSQYFRVVLNG